MGKSKKTIGLTMRLSILTLLLLAGAAAAQGITTLDTLSDSDPAGTNCTKGEYPDNEKCEKCPENTYKDLDWNVSCTKCPPGKNTEGKTGSKEESDCKSDKPGPTPPAGENCTKGESPDKEKCEKCPENTYKDLDW